MIELKRHFSSLYNQFRSVKLKGFIFCFESSDCRCCIVIHVKVTTADDKLTTENNGGPKMASSFGICKVSNQHHTGYTK